MENLETYHQWNQQGLDLFEAMKDTPQSPIHHGEGDVYVHTQMVLEEVKKSAKFPTENLIYTALLHDIAKPLTTKFEAGDWCSPGHAKLGEAVAREILAPDFTFEKREEISALIRYHGLPIWFQDKRQPKQAIIEASLRCNLNELATFAECDFRGRISNDLEKNLFQIELFREAAEDLNCLHSPYPFETPWQRLSFFKRDTHETAPIWEPEGPWFVVMCGMPGAGKNTWVKKNWKGKVLELDEIRKELKISPTDKKAQGTIFQVAKEKLKESMRKNEDLLWNATSLSVLQRSTIIDIALQYKAKIKIVYIDASIDKILKRNRERPNDKQMPPAVIASKFRKLEIPTLVECHELEIVKA